MLRFTVSTFVKTVKDGSDVTNADVFFALNELWMFFYNKTLESLDSQAVLQLCYPMISGRGHFIQQNMMWLHSIA